MNQDKTEQRIRVLLMYITRVSGHRQATVAIQRALRQLDPQVEVPCVNGFGYTYPVLEKIVNRAYMSVIKRTPKVWDYLYDNPQIVTNTQSIQKFLHKTSREKLRKLFERHNPDTVVCTQAFPCGMVSDYKLEHKLKTRLIGVLTDYAPHSFWINEGVDYYVVPSIETKERFIQKGVAPDSIKVYGIPIQLKFAMQLDKQPILDRMGLDHQKPVILIMGGGQGLGPIKEIVKSLIRVEMDFQIIVLTGTNKSVFRSLKKLSVKTKKKLWLLEFAKNVDELMEIATLIITKPGGLSTAESLAKGLPMVIVNPIPGQEERNTDFLVKKGIGIRINKACDIGEEMELLLKSPSRLDLMSKSAYAHAHPYAALDIGKLILGGDRQDLRNNHDELS